MKSEFWESDQFRQRATEVLVGISRAIVQDPIMKVWVLGLQLVNEAIAGAGDRGMWSWYDSTLAAIATVDSTLPVYLSDAWNSVPALDVWLHSAPLPLPSDNNGHLSTRWAKTAPASATRSSPLPW